jgi:hypothetical protein
MGGGGEGSRVRWRMFACEHTSQQVTVVSVQLLVWSSFLYELCAATSRRPGESWNSTVFEEMR